MSISRVFFAVCAVLLWSFQVVADQEVVVVLRYDVPPVLQGFDVPRSAESHSLLIQELQQSFYVAHESFVRSIDSRTRFGSAEILAANWLAGTVTLRADESLTEELRKLPSVRSIYPNYEIHLSFSRDLEAEEDEYTYGLRAIGIPAVRRDHPNVTGEGIRVGILDTGIDPTHPDLIGRMAEDDFRNFVSGASYPPKPIDDHGHGTHVAGTIAGGNASGKWIGVAPKATLVVGKIFDGAGRAKLSDILDGMQWMADPDGNPETVSDVPRLVSNSWGGGGDNTDESPLYRAVQVWRKLQILPVFAAGNDGPREASVHSPGLYPNSFTVGAVDEMNEIAYFSSRGPGKMKIGGQDTLISKPNVSAPGVKVFSALPGGGYDSWSGTSMATPHVAGAAALLFQANENLTVEKVWDLLSLTAQDLGASGYDSTYGFGLIKLPAALDACLDLGVLSSENFLTRNNKKSRVMK